MSMPNVEDAVLIAEATDETLIQSAKAINASYQGHLKRSIEDFWKLGQTLSHLFQRRHLQGRWADILAEIGINVTTDNHARRLYRETSIEGLSEFKNKTAALRYFGILSTPKTAREVPVASSPEDALDRSKEPADLPGSGEAAFEPQGEFDMDRPAKAERPERRIILPMNRRAEEPSQIPSQNGDDRTPPVGQSTIGGADDPLQVLAMIAARLECLAADVSEVTPDHLAQIDRMLPAIEAIRSKGVINAG